MPWLPAAVLVLVLLPAGAISQSDTADTKDSDVGDFAHRARSDDDGADRSLVATSSADGTVLLGWQCTETGMRIVLAMGWRFVGNQDDDILVAHRFPADSVATETLWRLSRTGTVAWMRIGHIVTFSDRALAADSVRMTLADPFDGESRDEVFGLTGLEPALDRLGCDMRRPSEPGGS